MATAYLWHAEALPLIALVFRDARVGSQIFKELRTVLGEIDEQEKLRISILTGIDATHPSSYKVLISSNIDWEHVPNANHLLIVSRINRMDPPDLQNLNAFLENYKRVGAYWLVPAIFTGDADLPEPLFDLCIGKRALEVREAWRIGENDPDAVAFLEEDDEPIIPDGVEDAPILRTLQRFGMREARKSDPESPKSIRKPRTKKRRRRR